MKITWAETKSGCEKFDHLLMKRLGTLLNLFTEEMNFCKDDSYSTGDNDHDSDHHVDVVEEGLSLLLLLQLLLLPHLLLHRLLLLILLFANNLLGGFCHFAIQI